MIATSTFAWLISPTTDTYYFTLGNILKKKIRSTLSWMTFFKSIEYNRQCIAQIDGEKQNKILNFDLKNDIWSIHEHKHHSVMVIHLVWAVLISDQTYILNQTNHGRRWATASFVGINRFKQYNSIIGTYGYIPGVSKFVDHNVILLFKKKSPKLKSKHSNGMEVVRVWV